MKLHRRSVFLCVFFLCPAAAAAAGFQVCPSGEGEQPAGWAIWVDREPADATPAVESPAAEAVAAERERVAPAPEPLAVVKPLANLRADALFRQAYEDVYAILSKENECSRFYGGPAPAAYVFNQLAARFRPGRVGGWRVAGRMGGGTINVRHEPTGLRFRLFEETLLNTEGAFYRRQDSRSHKMVPRVGSFAPDTRAARALILLHELGHLLRGEGGRWLLEDDGDDASLSERNTKLVEERCAGRLRALEAQPQGRPAELAESPPRAPGQ